MPAPTASFPHPIASRRRRKPARAGARAIAVALLAATALAGGPAAAGPVLLPQPPSAAEPQKPAVQTPSIQAPDTDSLSATAPAPAPSASAALPDAAPTGMAPVSPLAMGIQALLTGEEPLVAADAAPAYAARGRLDAIAKVYAARDNAPMWIEDGVPSREARRLLARLRQADREGLSPSDYVLPEGLGKTAGLLDERTAARFDVLLSLALVHYADHAQAGRVAPSSLSSMITAVPVRPDPAAALALLGEADDPVAALEGFSPPHAGYAALRAKLADLTRPGAEAERPPLVPAGATLKPGQRDPRVIVLRQRLGLAASEANGDLFDDELKAAVAAFQEKNGLHSDGIVGPRTLLALNAVADEEMAVSDIIANMERWRWLPRDLGAFHVLVNIPEFQARVYRDGVRVHETRVVVGKPANQTPVFSDVMDHIIVNPYWNVPYSIASQELLSSIQANVSYLASRNYEVLAGGRVVDPAAIDWSGVNLRSVRIRQRPGQGNALGDIKFMFPNQHAVYLHDTPSKSLFGRPSRAFSHGCVRVQDPFAFADAVLQLDPEWNAAKLKRMLGGGEKRVDLDRPVPVHLVYFTAFVDANGALQRRPDIYGHNATLTRALAIEGWEAWQRYAVVVPKESAAPVARAPRPERQVERLSLAEQRAKLMQRRLQAGSDLYR